MMSINKRIYLSPPHISEYEYQYVVEAFQSNWIAPIGPHVNGFEKEISEYVNIGGALAVNSGTSAIHLSLRCLGVGPGDKVFCSTLTFVASANPIFYQGAEPVFIDSDSESWNMSPTALQKAFAAALNTGKLPKAVIIVNLYGQSANMEPLINICEYYGVPIIEDAAESLGSTYQGRASGTFGKFGVYSFNGNKIITTSGGGMLVSNDLESLEKARFYATQACDRAQHYQHSQLGYNYRLSNVLAAIGRGQLRVLDDRIRARRAVFDRYYEALSPIEGIRFMKEMPYGRTNRWLTVLLLDPHIFGATTLELMTALCDQNIESRLVWKPLHLQPLFAGYSYYTHGETESVSDHLFRNGICLPSSSNLSEEEQKYVIYCIRQLLEKWRCIYERNIDGAKVSGGIDRVY
jgi:pyridoxal phosphate-dependent aminotransferase EpsN